METAAETEGKKASELVTSPMADKAAKKAGKKKVRKVAAPKKKPEQEFMSGLDAAVKVLAHHKKAMNAADIAKEAISKGWWNPQGKTPVATLYSAMFTEIKKKGAESRFARGEVKGEFVLAK